MEMTGKDLARCIDACLECHRVCLHVALTHCLEMGGAHVEATHFRLMMNCAELCETSANFMLTGSEFHQRTCGLCADVCDACAASCEAVGGMEKCVHVCRTCAEHCRAMAA